MTVSIMRRSCRQTEETLNTTCIYKRARVFTRLATTERLMEYWGVPRWPPGTPRRGTFGR